MEWLGLGDRNSRFFHKVNQSWNIRNTIRRIVAGDGRILTSPSDVKHEAVDHSAAFLNGSRSEELCVCQEEFIQFVNHRCTSDDANKLRAPVQAEEIRKILFSMPTNQTPSPHGYPWNFIKRHGQYSLKILSLLSNPFSFMVSCPIASMPHLSPWFPRPQMLKNYRI